MTTLRALAVLLVLVAVAAPARAESSAPNGQKIEAANFDGLAYPLSISAPPKNKPRPAPFAALALTGHSLSFQGGKLTVVVQGLPPIPPIPFQAYKTGDLIHITSVASVDVIDKANKSALIGALTISGTISDSGKIFIGTMDWVTGESKATHKKVSIDCEGHRPEKPEKPEKK
jgi:hypothetical protein